MFEASWKELSKAKRLFRVDISGDELWDKYLTSFEEGTNNIYRVRTEHDCSVCRHVIKHVGAVVAITSDGEVRTVWDFDATGTIYAPVVKAMQTLVKSAPVVDVFATTFDGFGTDSTPAVYDGEVVVFDHLYVKMPNAHRVPSRTTSDSYRGELRTNAQVFKSSMENISVEAVDVVLELIGSNSLYRGAEWSRQLLKFREYKRAYDALKASDKANYCWFAGTDNAVIARMKNHSIGLLLQDITEGVDLDEAVRKYEAVVAPENYKRPKAIFTKRMLEDAQKKLEELGLSESIGRRFATLEDVRANNILFVNRDVAPAVAKEPSAFEKLQAMTKGTSSKKFSKLETIGIDKFVSDVLPTATELEVYVGNEHMQNFVSLIGPQNETAPSLFKWDNPYSWAYTGNIADSSIKRNVEKAGGDVNGVLRFSIQWNDGEVNRDDLDAHCIEPGHEREDSREVYFGHKHGRSAELDVDIIIPTTGKAAVENITVPRLEKLLVGTYRFFVHRYCNHGGRSFKAELEYGGTILQFEVSNYKSYTDIVEVTWTGTEFKVNTLIPPVGGHSSPGKEMWGITTNNFIPVSTVMYSPNYWDSQSGVGNLHYFFMLKGCINPEEPNGFYNEQLKSELTPHRRVFEALGAAAKVPSAQDQLSGIGFSATKRAELVVKVKGHTERMLKVLF